MQFILCSLLYVCVATSDRGIFRLKFDKGFATERKCATSRRIPYFKRRQMFRRGALQKTGPRTRSRATWRTPILHLEKQTVDVPLLYVQGVPEKKADIHRIGTIAQNHTSYRHNKSLTCALVNDDTFAYVIDLQLDNRSKKLYCPSN